MRIEKNLTWLFSPSSSFVRCKCSNIDGTNFIFCQLPRWGCAKSTQTPNSFWSIRYRTQSDTVLFLPFSSHNRQLSFTSSPTSPLTRLSLSYIDLTKYDDVFRWKFHVFYPSSLWTYLYMNFCERREKQNSKICKQTMSLREQEWRTLLDARYQWKLWEWEKCTFCITNFRSEKRERDDPLMERTCRHFSAVMIRRQQNKFDRTHLSLSEKYFLAMWERWKYVCRWSRQRSDKIFWFKNILMEIQIRSSVVCASRALTTPAAGREVCQIKQFWEREIMELKIRSKF